jgi:hypothetical protein
MKEHTMAATMSTINGDILQRVWNELDYRTDVCHMTGGAQIEHL